MSLSKPTNKQLQQYTGTKMADIIAPNLRVLFCGINPGLYSAATGHHFARPGNRFWKALFLGGFTKQILSPEQDLTLPKMGLGITNFVPRATISANELLPQEFKQGADILEEKVRQYKPEFVAFLGIGAYKLAFNKPLAKLGLQEEMIGKTKIWLLPNTSGLNAHFQVAKLGEIFKELFIASS